MDRLLARGLKALARARMFGAETIVRDMGQPRLSWLVDEQPGYISFMREVLNEAVEEKNRRKER